MDEDTSIAGKEFSASAGIFARERTPNTQIDKWYS